MHECMQCADKLFEKFSRDVDRKTQASAWDAVLNSLKKKGIKVESVQKIKQNVSNWIRRTNVSTVFSFTIFK